MKPYEHALAQLTKKVQKTLREPDWSTLAYANNSRLMYIVDKEMKIKLELLEKVSSNFRLVHCAGSQFNLFTQQILNIDGIVLAAMVASIEQSDLDLFGKALVYVYQAKAKVLPLIHHLIDTEIATSDDEGTLFRSGSLAVKMFSVYSKIVGLPYLWKTLAVNLNVLHQLGNEAHEEDRETFLGVCYILIFYSNLKSKNGKKHVTNPTNYY